MMRKRTLSYEKKKSMAGYFFILPWLIGFFGLFFRTLVTSFIYSISTVSITTSGVEVQYAGFENYSRAFLSDSEFLPRLTSQLQEMITDVPMILAFSLFISVMLNQQFRGRTIARAVFFLPVIIASGVVITIIQGDAMNQSIISGTRASGLFESSSFADILLENGLNSEMVDQMMNVVNNIFELSWRSGLQILLFIAALQTVPEQLYEVAKVEGATAWESFFKITLPMITPIAIVNVIFTVIDNFTDYGNSLLRYIQTLGKRLDFAYSAALGYIYFAIIFVVVMLVLLVIGKKVTYIEK